MLDNARKYREELKNKMLDTWYDEKYKYYHSGGWHREYLPPEDDWERMSFVSLDTDGNIIGCIMYSMDRNTNSAYDFGAINFSDDKLTFGMDLYQVIDGISGFPTSQINFLSVSRRFLAQYRTNSGTGIVR